jgi:Ca2+-binding EF-hand superfamily protein
MFERPSYRILTILLVAGGAMAQFPEGRGPGRGGFPPPVGFTTLDTNGDGTLDADEINAASTVLAKLDKNSDGQITADEVRPAFPDRRGGEGRRGPEGEGRRGPEGEAGGNVVEEMVKTLMAFDANGDGKLSKSELPERMQGLFDRADENKDGFLTADEIRKLAAVQARPPQNDGPGERGGPGRDMNFIRMDPVLAAVDTNGDGVLSSEELRNAPKAIRKLDSDGDGKITREEMMAAMRRRRESENRDR